MPSKLLIIGNPSKTIDNLSGIIDSSAISAIKREYDAQVALLYTLALDHYRFAVAQRPKQWRQKVSRLYYAAYVASRAVRLCVHGHFSTEVTDHKKVGTLPDDFPNRQRYNNKLDVLREDRNTCDYDHCAKAGDLVATHVDAEDTVRQLLVETKSYLEARGIVLRGAP